MARPRPEVVKVLSSPDFGPRPPPPSILRPRRPSSARSRSPTCCAAGRSAHGERWAPRVPPTGRRTVPGVFAALNRLLRRRRRRLVVVAATLAIASAVVGAHSVASHGHMGDALVMCLAVAESAVVAVAAALALGARRPRRRRLRDASAPCHLMLVVADRPVRVRAGPPLLGVFRL